MIKINLLPTEEKRDVKGRGQVIAGIFAIAAVFILLIAVDLIQAKRIEDTNERIAYVKAEIKKREVIKKEVEEFKAKNKQLEDKIKVIQVLEENRAGPLFVMDALGGSMPERAWVDKFSEKQYAAKIEGIAWSELTVSDFMKKLQSSPYFRNVELNVIKTKEMQNLPLKNFVITSNLNYSGKIEDQATEEGQDKINTNHSEAKR